MLRFFIGLRLALECDLGFKNASNNVLSKLLQTEVNGIPFPNFKPAIQTTT
jgi:hypothetical protein